MNNFKMDHEEVKKKANSYLKYSSMVFQMIGVIGLFTFIGYKIDEKLNSSTPYFTAFLSLFGVIIAIIIIFRSLKSDKNG